MSNEKIMVRLMVRCVLWSGAPYGLRNTVILTCLTNEFTSFQRSFNLMLLNIQSVSTLKCLHLTLSNI